MKRTDVPAEVDGGRRPLPLRCEECGYAIDEVGESDTTILVSLLRSLLDEWTELFATPSAVALSVVRTAESAWSALERAAQVRDVLHAKANRLERLRDTDDPPLEEILLDTPRAGDNELPPQAVVAALAANGRRLAALADAMPRSRWTATGRRGGVAITAVHVLDEAVHRTLHDLRDAQLLLAVAGTHPSRLSSQRRRG